MADNGRLQDYLIAVAGCIRWKKARGPLLRELESHITDQERDFVHLGMTEDEAREQAVGEMGDPVTVGIELDRLHRPKTSWGLILCVVVLLLVSISILALSSRAQLLHQLLALGGGLVAIAVLWRWDYTIIIRHLWVWVGLFAAGCIVVGVFSPQARRLAFLFLLIPILYAALLCRLRGRGKFAVIALSLLIFPLAALSALLPTFSSSIICGTAMLVALTSALWLGWFRVGRQAGLICMGVPTLAVSLYCVNSLTHMPYVISRLTLVFRPELDPLGKGFEATVVRGVLERTPFFRTPNIDAGLSLNEVQLLHYKGLELANYAARFGTWILVAAGLLIVLFAFVSLYRISKLKSISGRLMAYPCATALVVQAAGYLFTNCGWRFMGADAFPFFTYGPGYLLIDLILVGVLLSVFRMDALVRDVAEGRYALPIPPKSIDIRLPFGRGKIHIERQK